MSRSVIALFVQSFPAALPHAWRVVWRAHLVSWMDWLIALFLFALPWFAIPHWVDPVELPKALLSIGAMALWFVFRGAYSALGQLELQEGSALPRRWSAFSVWMIVLAGAASISWVLAASRGMAWLGNGAQISSSFATILTALWLIGAVYEATQRSVLTGRFFTRSWFAGMCVALIGSLLVRITAGAAAAPSIFSVGRIFDLWLFLPVVWLVGLGLLATRGSIQAPLTFRKLARYRLSHLVLALVLLATLIGGLLVDLGWLWLILFGGSIIVKVLLISAKRYPSLAGFLSLLGLFGGLFGLLISTQQLATPQWIVQGRQAVGMNQLSEVLPSQKLSWHVTKAALQDAPLFGAGPTSWMSVFDRERPLELNQTPIWNVRFPRSASLLTTVLTEYGLVPSVLATLFFLILLGVATRVAIQSKDPGLAWHALFVVAGIVFATLRPTSTLSVLSLSFLAGLLAARVFLPAKAQLEWSERRVFSHSAVGACLVLAMVASMVVFQRAVAADLLTSNEAYALPLTRRLNPADDFTYAREALISLDQAEVVAGRGDLRNVLAWLDRADQAIAAARDRNPTAAEHVALALRSAQLRTQLDEKAEERVFALAAELDALRPTDPGTPLAIFGVQRLRVAREAQIIAQEQDPERKEVALHRETQAKSAAESALQESLRRKADFAPALYARASWLAQQGETRQAIASLEQLAEQNRDRADLLVPLALLYRRNQEPLKAAAVFEALALRAPQTLEYTWQQSLALIQAERWNEATVVLQRLVATDPRAIQYQQQLQEVLRRRAQASTPVIATSTSATATSTATSTTPTPKSSTRRRVTR